MPDLVCRMYLVLGGEEASSLTCPDGMKFNFVDQFVSPVDFTKHALGRRLSKYASSSDAVYHPRAEFRSS